MQAMFKSTFGIKRPLHIFSTTWIPVQDVAMITQQITGETVIAGTDKWLTVNWAPVDDGTHHEHWCVKVKVTVAGEPNTDNKIDFVKL